MPSEPRVPLPMSSFSRRSSNVTLSVSPTLSQSSVANAICNGSQLQLQRPKKLSLEVSSNSSRRNSSSYSSVRRCHSVRCSNTRTQSFASLNGVNYSPSLRSRRVSSSVLLEKNIDNEVCTYEKYKISRANPDSLVNLVIEDSISPGDSKLQCSASLSSFNQCLLSDVHRVLVLGVTGCGKSTIVSSFKSQLEEQRGGYQSSGSGNSPKSSTFDGKASKGLILHFSEMEITPGGELTEAHVSFYRPDAYLILYSVSDRESFEAASSTLSQIQKWQKNDFKPVIVVANKSDLVRSRCVSKQEGRQTAIDYNCKYIETSCTISLNIDFLLAGIGAQINLRSSGKKKGITKKPSIFRRLLNRAVLYRSRSCDNLSVL